MILNAFFSWFGFGVDMGFSVVFSLIQAGVIPPEHYRKFRKLALRVLQAMPPDEALKVFEEARTARDADRSRD